jgi:hypothetical protein
MQDRFELWRYSHRQRRCVRLDVRICHADSLPRSSVHHN